MYNLSPSISILYTQVAPNMKYFPSISNYFEPKNRDVIHIASPSNYSRNVIYGNLKFNKFITSPAKGVEHEIKDIMLVGIIVMIQLIT